MGDRTLHTGDFVRHANPDISAEWGTGIVTLAEKTRLLVFFNGSNREHLFKNSAFLVPAAPPDDKRCRERLLQRIRAQEKVVDRQTDRVEKPRCWNGRMPEPETWNELERVFRNRHACDFATVKLENPKVWESERGCVERVASVFREKFSRRRMEELCGRKKYSTVARDFLATCGPMLVHPHLELPHVQRALYSRKTHKALAETLFTLLHGNVDDLPSRFDMFGCFFLKRLCMDFWSVATLPLFLQDVTNHACFMCGQVKAAALTVGYANIDVSRPPTWKKYRKNLDFLFLVRKRIDESLHPRDMIDVNTFLSVTTGNSYPGA